MRLQAGVRLGDRYLLRDRIGAGGMGEVWRAVDGVLGRTVAVKVMLPGVTDDARFAAEATAMARVNHPAVAAVHDFGRADGVAYLVMEFVDGESLSQRLARDGRMTPDATMLLVAQAADGLQAIHDQGLVHRDIKPANLLVRADGTVVITDFGIARHADAARLTVSGAILGTPTYLSPEQVRGEPAGTLSDVYSLGLVAYECLSGERPFAGDNPYAVALQRLQSPPKTIGITLPDHVRTLVQKAIATEPADRWQSARSFAEAARFRGPTGDRTGSPKPAGRSRLVAASLVTLLILVTGMLGVTTWILVDRDTTTDRGTGDESFVERGSGVEPATLPDGFAVCDDAYCPSTPMCWGGLTAISGTAMPPSRRDCADAHAWETFRAVPLPAGGVTISSDHPLIDKPDIAAACSAAAMTARAGSAVTAKWVRDAWPIPYSTGTLLHCIARSPLGETEGPAFRSR
ncbi:serine/threonine-protein kinase [Actinoplanes sp. NBRC 101535]|uniref:serine/threonine-protein kinase n=1 Tax=Actinoplanes sp. NBRC 101535 TaxID=3032196 RepID=UPI002552E218|nr:serine/threonine-protein kinase [Actinoplanes sp. NBRC 101535]